MRTICLAIWFFFFLLPLAVFQNWKLQKTPPLVPPRELVSAAKFGWEHIPWYTAFLGAVLHNISIPTEVVISNGPAAWFISNILMPSSQLQRPPRAACPGLNPFQKGSCVEPNKNGNYFFPFARTLMERLAFTMKVGIRKQTMQGRKVP